MEHFEHSYQSNNQKDVLNKENKYYKSNFMYET